jgi:hypothetical protein
MPKTTRNTRRMLKSFRFWRLVDSTIVKRDLKELARKETTGLLNPRASAPLPAR